MPAPHRLLTTYAAVGPGVNLSRLECSLAHSHHAYLWQHVVSGRSILPGAAMFEAAHAAVAMLTPGNSAEQNWQQGRVGVNAAAIAAPLLLKPPGQASLHLAVSIQRLTGSVQLSSRLASAGSRSSSHLSAIASGCLTASAAVAAAKLQHSSGFDVLRPCLASTAAAVWLGEAVGTLSFASLLPAIDGYNCHPAVVDAATHFGAVLDLETGSLPRVPVSLGRYAASSMQPTNGLSFTTAAAGSMVPGGRRVSNYRVCNSVTLEQLQSTPIGSLVPQRQPQANNPQQSLIRPADAHPELATACFTYCRTWQAASPTPAPPDYYSMPTWALARLHTGSGCRASLAAPAGGFPEAALLCYATVLRLLQDQLTEGTPTPFAAIIPAAACQYGAPLEAPAQLGSVPGFGAASVQGLLAVASLEQPTMRLQLLAADALAAAGSYTHPAIADTFGAAFSAGASFQPSMQLAAVQPGAQSSTVGPAGPAYICAPPMQPVLHIISGAFGGLGLLTACHLAQQPGTLMLLGRSGRFAGASTMPQQIVALQGCVVLQQADISTAADAAVLQQHSVVSQTAASTFIHTAGVLSDRLLQNQNMTDARVVFAPKLAGLAACQAHLQYRPMQSFVHFSSVSAALGNRGQANYAAANSALDSTAAALSSQGFCSTSVQWGAWAGAGMAAQTPQLLHRLSKQGMHPEGGMDTQ